MEYIYFFLTTILVIIASSDQSQALDVTDFGTTETQDPTKDTPMAIPALNDKIDDHSDPTKDTPMAIPALNDKIDDHSVPLPPHIKLPISQEVEIVKDSLRMECKADGNPPPRYKWFRDGTLLKSDEGDRIQAFDDGTLVAKTFDKSLDGLFHCEATNMYGTSVSVAKPIMKIRPPVGVEFPDQMSHATEWDPYSIDFAKVPETLPTAYKKWYTGEGNENVQLVSNNRIGTDSNGKLHFAYLEKKDENKYFCSLSVSTNVITLYKRGQLIVTAKSKSKHAPTVQSVSEDVKATLGRPLTLDCFFSGYPIPDIEWKNVSNQVIKTNDKRHTIKEDVGGKQLYIKEVTASDKGNFQCIATNSEGRAEVTISVNVTSPPVRVKNRGLTRLTSPDQRDYSLYCESSVMPGERSDTPIWYRNGKKLTKDSLPYPSRYSFNSDLTKLTIKNLSKTMDTACFQCEVSNSEGRLFMDGYLNVIESIEISNQPGDDFIKVQLDNSEVDISVQARGDSCCAINYHWYLNKTDLPLQVRSEPPFSFNEQTNKFSFNASSVPLDELYSKLGKYKCRVSNTHEDIDIQFTISLTDNISPVGPVETTPAPKLITTEEAGIDLWWLGLIFGALVVAAIITGYVIYKKRTPSSSYPLETKELDHGIDREKDLLDQSFHEI